jgi:hypothetical protein
MTTVAVLADLPAETDALAGVVESGPLDAEEATRLYTATLRDACAAVERSGGELLVNYRTLDAPEEEAEEAVASAVAPALDDPEDARYEVQVGSTRSARVGNTVTHLLEREEVRSAAVLDPAVALAERRHVDSAAMKLRGAEVVLGPTPGGAVWYAGFTEPVDFADAFAPPSLRTLTERGSGGGLDVEFIESRPLVSDYAGLASAVVSVQSRTIAGRPVPGYTRRAVADLGLDVAATGDELDVHTGADTDRS